MFGGRGVLRLFEQVEKHWLDERQARHAVGVFESRAQGDRTAERVADQMHRPLERADEGGHDRGVVPKVGLAIAGKGVAPAIAVEAGAST